MCRAYRQIHAKSKIVSKVELRELFNPVVCAEVDVKGKEPPKFLEILVDNRALKVPAGPDYTDNFVVGLGLDFTSPGSLPHPNPEKEDLAGAPLLLLATSDSALRFYRFANTQKSLDGIMCSPSPLKRPALLPPPGTEPGEPFSLGLSLWRMNLKVAKDRGVR